MNFEHTTLAKTLGEYLLERALRIGTAESCTGGLVAAAITDVAGSSQWFDEGLVTYANQSKTRLLGVSEAVLEQQGAVSQAVVEQMVKGVLANGADIAIATSGIAGPGGGTDGKPVGTVWFAWGDALTIQSAVQHFSGGRQSIRQQATFYALECVVESLKRSRR